MRHNDKYEDLCTHYWPEKVTKVNGSTSQNILHELYKLCAKFHVLSKSAQFLATLLYYSKYLHLVCKNMCDTTYKKSRMCDN